MVLAIKFDRFGYAARLCCALPPWLAAFVSSAFARPTPERFETMNPRAPLIDADGEVRELSAADMLKFKPATEVLPLQWQREFKYGQSLY
jgi:hypothetical protein